MIYIYQFFLILPLIILIALIGSQYLRKKLRNSYGLSAIILISIFLGGHWGYACAAGTGTSGNEIYWIICGISIIGVLLLALYSIIIYWIWLKKHPFWRGFVLGLIIFNIITIKIVIYGGWEENIFFNPILIKIFPNVWLQIPITVLPVMFYSFLTGSIYFAITKFFKK